jgi:hypothetical protein
MRFGSLTLGFLLALPLALPIAGWTHNSDDRGDSRHVTRLDP